MTMSDRLRPVMPDLDSPAAVAATAQLKSLTISSVAFESDGSTHITYHQPHVDVRSDGVISAHTMFVPLGADYDAEIMVILEALRHLVLDVQDDGPHLPPVPEEPHPEE